MIEPPRNSKVASCAPIATQRATFDDFGATNRATDNATNSLKALAGAVLERNNQRNRNTTEAENQRNFCTEKNTEKLREVAGDFDDQKQAFDTLADDRRYCRQCLKFSAGNRCMVFNERQQDDIPRRCDKFKSNGKPAFLSSLEERDIRAWLEQIGETDAVVIDETIQRCKDGLDTRRYFLQRADEVRHD